MPLSILHTRLAQLRERLSMCSKYEELERSGFDGVAGTRCRRHRDSGDVLMEEQEGEPAPATPAAMAENGQDQPGRGAQNCSADAAAAAAVPVPQRRLVAEADAEAEADADVVMGMDMDDGDVLGGGAWPAWKEPVDTPWDDQFRQAMVAAVREVAY